MFTCLIFWHLLQPILVSSQYSLSQQGFSENPRIFNFLACSGNRKTGIWRHKLKQVYLNLLSKPQSGHTCDHNIRPPSSFSSERIPGVGFCLMTTHSNTFHFEYSSNRFEVLSSSLNVCLSVFRSTLCCNRFWIGLLRHDLRRWIQRDPHSRLFTKRLNHVGVGKYIQLLQLGSGQ